MPHCELHVPKITMCEFKALWKAKYIFCTSLKEQKIDKEICIVY